MMQFSTSPGQLLRALQQASAMKVPMMRFRADSGHLHLRAFDRLVPAWCEVSAPVQVDTPGEAYFHTEPLLRLLAVYSGSSEEIHFRHNTQKNLLDTIIEGSKYAIRSPDADLLKEQPDMPSCPKKLYSNPGGFLDVLSSAASIADSTKRADTRCQHVLFYPEEDGNVKVAASDTVMVGIHELSGGAESFPDGNVALSSHAARLALRIFHGETDVEVAVHDSKFFFKGLYASLVTHLSQADQTMLEDNQHEKPRLFKTLEPCGEFSISGEEAGSNLRRGLLLASMSGADRVHLLANQKGLQIQTQSDIAASSVHVPGEGEMDVMLLTQHLDIALTRLGDTQTGLNFDVYAKDGYPAVVSVQSPDIKSEFWAAPTRPQ